MRIIVAITGATGVAYGVRLLAALEQLGVERHLIVSRWAEVTILKETGLPRLISRGTDHG
jgi:flavin prenyltransferase